MSHDRGCPCGKEKYEADDCKRSWCLMRGLRLPGPGTRREARQLERAERSSAEREQRVSEAQVKRLAWAIRRLSNDEKRRLIEELSRDDS